MAISTATGVQYASGQDYYDHILTDHYRNVVADTRNNSCALMSMIPENTEYVGGRFITFPARTRRNIGTNAVRYASGYKMPDPGSQGFDQYSFAPRHIYGRVKVDALTWDAAQKDVDRYIDLLDTELGGLADDMSIEMNRMLHNDGSGRLAQNTTAGGVGTALTLVVNQGIESASTCTTPPTLYLNVGDRIAFMASDATSVVAKYVLSKTASTITVADTPGGASDSTGCANGDWITRISNSDGGTDAVQALSSGYKAEPMGLAGMFSDADIPDGTGLLANASAGIAGTFYYGTVAGNMSFQGVDSDANTWNQAVVLDGGGTPRPLTEDLLQYAFSEAEERNNAEIDMLLSGYAMRDTYVSLLLPAKRFNNTMELAGGHKALNFNGKAWAVDRFCYRNRIYGLALAAAGFCRFMVRELGFVDMGGGAKWGKTSFDDDNMQAAVVERLNFGCEVRERLGFLLTDITEIR